MSSRGCPACPCCCNLEDFQQRVKVQTVLAVLLELPSLLGLHGLSASVGPRLRLHELAHFGHALSSGLLHGVLEELRNHIDGPLHEIVEPLVLVVRIGRAQTRPLQCRLSRLCALGRSARRARRGLPYLARRFLRGTKLELGFLVGVRGVRRGRRRLSRCFRHGGCVCVCVVGWLCV